MAELKAEFPESKVEMSPGDKGAFEIFRDGESVFSKLGEGRFPDDGEIVRLLKS